MLQKRIDEAVQAQASARPLSLEIEWVSSEDEESQQSDTSCYTTKLLNLFKLSDGKGPTFKHWILDMEDKLLANADHFETPKLCIAYIWNWMEGWAREHLQAHSQLNTSNRYQNLDEMLVHLQTIFKDVNWILITQAKFQSLFQCTMKFQNFLSNFIYWAGEAQKPHMKWKEKLYYWLSYKLQNKVMLEWIDNSITFNNFTHVHKNGSVLRAVHHSEEHLELMDNLSEEH